MGFPFKTVTALDLFVDVVLPLPLSVLTYRLPVDLGNVQLGSLLLAPLKDNRFWPAVVLKKHHTKPACPAKMVWSKLSVDPIFDQKQLLFFQWMANYYLCPLGQVISLALPRTWRSLQNLTFTPVHSIYGTTLPALDEPCKALYHAILQRPLTHRALKKIIGKTTIFTPAICYLLTNNLIQPQPILMTAEQKQSAIMSAPSYLPLTKEQQQAFDEICHQFSQKDVVLCHGVVGSGKTALYIKLIYQALLQNKQVLLLLPDTGLVMHMVERIQSFLGAYLAAYHAKQSPKEQLLVWEKIYHGHAIVVIGTRSALFLPFRHLGYIIIDEEHDMAYKQQHKQPMYHARESSIILARYHHAKVLLASATPSIESYYNAQIKKFGLVLLSKRFVRSNYPLITFIDLNRQRQEKAIREQLSFPLLAALAKNILNQGQAIIFQNRRGYARYFLCQTCGWIPNCKSCSVSLTYHQKPNQLVCHYCNYAVSPYASCLHCGSSKLHNVGIGTEKLEETLQLIFPHQTIARIDLDNVKSKRTLQSILSKIASREINIIVGTQIIAKGLDFANIQVIGVIDIDNLLYFPDFRSHEKCFQIIAQLAGRAGRGDQQGHVLIQTRQPGNQLFKYLVNNDYLSMYNQELQERKAFNYPPYVRLIALTLRCKNGSLLHHKALEIKSLLEQHLAHNILGPQVPLVGKIKDIFLIHLLIKVPNSSRYLNQTKTFLQELCSKHTKPSAHTVQIVIDVDPL